MVNFYEMKPYNTNLKNKSYVNVRLGCLIVLLSVIITGMALWKLAAFILSKL
ncbi:hypothetical protein METHB2_30072 [Candidatus Methylobacter favarea]|uniref:Uncharacterized protein n=1 Tax=Candidatus Methylobacter favarea TaxID=2707345 RepID=A0A8S0X0X4_9GAMM|nr:hypothetical protein METHB2_30072 [Candidatus Methylobacter favarea]